MPLRGLADGNQALKSLDKQFARALSHPVCCESLSLSNTGRAAHTGAWVSEAVPLLQGRRRLN